VGDSERPPQTGSLKILHIDYRDSDAIMGQQRGCDPLLDFPENFDDMETSAPPTPT